jgi:hypothetical protein
MEELVKKQEKEIFVLRKYLIRSLFKEVDYDIYNGEQENIILSLSTLSLKHPLRHYTSFTCCVQIITGHEDLFPVNESLYRFLEYYNDRFEIPPGTCVGIDPCSSSLVCLLIDVGFVDKYIVSVSFFKEGTMLKNDILRKGGNTVYSNNLYNYFLRHMITT